MTWMEICRMVAVAATLVVCLVVVNAVLAPPMRQWGFDRYAGPRFFLKAFIWVHLIAIAIACLPSRYWRSGIED